MSARRATTGANAPGVVSKEKSSDSVHVAVRCRPMVEKERSMKAKPVVSCNLAKHEVELHPLKSSAYGTVEIHKVFVFDYVFDARSTQRDVYTLSAKGIVENVLKGYNGTIFAYGQTGTGKTFTIDGDPEDEDDPAKRGVTPQAFWHIFDHVNAHKEHKEYLIRASHLEIYNEEIRDLLGRDPRARLDLKESPDTGVYVKDLSTYVVKDVKQIDHIIAIGKRNRTTGATLMNIKSSRSHSIFTITVEQSETIEGKDLIRVGKLHLVDLAGSERQGKAGTSFDRLKEAARINLSLTALGMVITSLVDGKAHIPYRDSRLTRLLQDSLGGNAHTVMIATISPADVNYEESASTLRYASQARKIENRPRINEDPKDAMLRELHAEIARLKSQLETQEGPSVLPPNDFLAERERLQEERDRMETELELHRQQLEREREEREGTTRKLRMLEEQLISGDEPAKPKSTPASSRDKTSLSKQLEMKKKEMDKLSRKCIAIQDEAAAAHEEFLREQEKLLSHIGDLKRQLSVNSFVMGAGEGEVAKNEMEAEEYQRKLKVKVLVAESVLSAEDLRKLEDRAKWFQDQGDEADSQLKEYMRASVQNGELAAAFRGEVAAAPMNQRSTRLDLRMARYPLALDLGRKSLNDLSSMDCFDPTALKILDISENNLRGILKMEAFVNLKRLRASYNNIQTLVLSAPHLVTLHVSHNKLGSFPRVSVFPSLEVLDLSHNEMKGSIRDIFTCVCMLSFDISYNQFSWDEKEFEKEILEMVLHLKRLENISIHNNPFCTRVKDYRIQIMSSAYKLQRLDGKPFGAQDFSHMLSLDNPSGMLNPDTLHRMRETMHEGYEHERKLAEEAEAERQRELREQEEEEQRRNQRRNQLRLEQGVDLGPTTERLSTGYRMEGGPEKITELTEEYINALAGLANKDLSRARYPLYMDLSDERFELTTLSGLKHINGPALKELDVSENKLRSLGGLERFSNLKRLRAAYNILESVVMIQAKLVFLDLSHNHLTKIPSLVNLPCLHVLDLSYNNIRDSLRGVVCSLRLGYIDLSFNDLLFTEQEFDKERQPFKELKKLQSLHLFNNPFCFAVPNYRMMVLAVAQQLTELDDSAVTKDEKRRALEGARGTGESAMRLQAWRFSVRQKRSESKTTLDNVYFLEEVDGTPPASSVEAVPAKEVKTARPPTAEPKRFEIGTPRKSPKSPKVGGDAALAKLGQGKVISLLTNDVFNELNQAYGKDLATAKYPLSLDWESPQFKLVSLVGINYINAAALRDLNISENKLASLEGLERFQSLKRLSAANNQIKMFNARLGKLQHLDLSNNQLTHMPNLSESPNLEELILRRNVIRGSLSYLTPCRKLSFLDLSNNKFDWVGAEVDAEFVYLKALKNLRVLDLSGNPFAEAVPGYKSMIISVVPKLEDLDGEQTPNTPKKRGSIRLFLTGGRRK